MTEPLLCSVPAWCAQLTFPACAAAVAAVTGDRAIATEEVLGGAGIGGLLGLFLGRDRVTLIRVDPDQDLNLTLNSDLVLPTGSSNQ